MISQTDKVTATPFKIVIIGDSCAGKSSLLLRLVDDTFTESHKVTIGVDFKGKYIVTRTMEGQGKVVKLRIWDTAGQERFRSIIRTYYLGSDGIILAFDLTNLESFEHLNEWIEEIKETGLSSCPIILVGTKMDLANKRKVDQESIDNFVSNCKKEDFDIEYVECSSKLGTNVDFIFTQLATKLILMDFPETQSGKLELGTYYNFPYLQQLYNKANLSEITTQSNQSNQLDMTDQSRCCIIS